MLTCLSLRKTRRRGVHLLTQDFLNCLAAQTLFTRSTVESTASPCCNACFHSVLNACSWTPFSPVVSATLLTAFASRRAVPRTHATRFLRTRWASHSRTSSFPLPCVCALACPRFRLRCLLSVFCVENALTPGMRSLALPCVGVRSPPAMTAACYCWFASHAPTGSWHASSPRTWARASPTVSSSSLGK